MKAAACPTTAISWLQELDPKRAHQVITAYTLAFFDKYLRGQNSDLLNAPSDKYPEVTFKRKGT